MKEQYPWTNGEIPSCDENDDCLRLGDCLDPGLDHDYENFPSFLKLDPNFTMDQVESTSCVHCMITLQYGNQTFARKYLKLCKKFGAESVEVRSVFEEHVAYAWGVLAERHFAPNGTWPKYLMPTRAEAEWLEVKVVEE